MATTTDGFLTSSDGTRLFFRRHAAAAPRARVLVIHGFAEHSGRYLELLDALADAGFDALAFDLRGHGRSEGRRAHLRRFEDYLDDTRTAFAALTAGSDGTALVFGHSMGGLIATHFAASEPKRCRALALSGPMFTRALAVNPLKLLAAHVLGRLLPSFSMPSGITGAHLTSDPAEIALHDADPLVLHQARAGARVTALPLPQETGDRGGLRLLGLDHQVMLPARIRAPASTVRRNRSVAKSARAGGRARCRRALGVGTGMRADPCHRRVGRQARVRRAGAGCRSCPNGAP